MAHGDAREGTWRGNWRMQWVASTLHTTSEHGASSITTADAHTSAVSSRLNWRPRRFKWTRPFRRKTKSGFCACPITFQLASTTRSFMTLTRHCIRYLMIRRILFQVTFCNSVQKSISSIRWRVNISLSNSLWVLHTEERCNVSNFFVYCPLFLFYSWQQLLLKTAATNQYRAGWLHLLWRKEFT